MSRGVDIYIDMKAGVKRANHTAGERYRRPPVFVFGVNSTESGTLKLGCETALGIERCISAPEDDVSDNPFSDRCMASPDDFANRASVDPNP
jgi:hypothetical protein